MEERLTGLLFGALVGDALALGVHWIYDTKVIETQFGLVTDYLEPLRGSYHPTKKKGDFTHYGDQMLLLLDSVVERAGFDPEYFSQKWYNFMASYDGYKDQATLITLENLKRGIPYHKAGSPSNDLAGAIRAGVLGYVYGRQVDLFERFAQIQTQLTHNDPDTVLCARFFARLLNSVLNGRGIAESIEQILHDHFLGTNLERWVNEAFSFRGTIKDAVLRFGLTCHTPEIFPGIVFILKESKGELEKATIEAVMAGGDNATRASCVAMVIGAKEGIGAIPERWVNGLSQINRVKVLMERLKAIRDLH